MKIVSWNVAGIRACHKKNGLSFIETENPDIICFQESKCEESQFPKDLFPEYKFKYWNATKLRKGLHGTSIWSKIEPKNVNYGWDKEGRMIHLEYDNFNLINVYTPNSKNDLSRLAERVEEWDILYRTYTTHINENKPCILCGDFNVAHHEIDIYNHFGMDQSPGFTKLERQSFSLLTDTFVDIFRLKNPSKGKCFTFWPYMVTDAREKNMGWRLDYFLLDKSFVENVTHVDILADVHGSDHCPLSLVMKIT